MNREDVIRLFTRVADIVLAFPLVPAALVVKAVRRLGLQRLNICRWLLTSIGVLPLRRHYYEPFVVSSDLRQPLDSVRQLPGIEWNEAGQLNFLEGLTYESELEGLSDENNRFGFNINNGSFVSGDAEYLYQFIRKVKPKRIIEIGSGQSTLLARAAVLRNREEQVAYSCEHICIEPYEAPWLDKLGVVVLRQRVEDVDRAIFRALSANDLLFIDSSHVIRPQGDIITEYLEILPALSVGTFVHVHDIFSPRDYPADWLFEKFLLWNEQYLLEAFLSGNSGWQIMGALNMLKHDHFHALKRVCPYLTADREPGSFYIQKR